MTDHRVIHEANGYRILEVPDQSFDVQDSKGETYDPRHNPGIAPEVLAEEERHYEEFCSREGAFGYVLEKWNPATGAGWEHVDSCFGFVGQFTAGEEVFNHYIVEELKRQIPEPLTDESPIDMGKLSRYAGKTVLSFRELKDLIELEYQFKPFKA